MKLTGELKTQVENTNTKEEAKEVLEKAGMELNDEELDQVVGGMKITSNKSEKILNPLLKLIQKLIGKQHRHTLVTIKTTKTSYNNNLINNWVTKKAAL